MVSACCEHAINFSEFVDDAKRTPFEDVKRLQILLSVSQILPRDNFFSTVKRNLLGIN